MIHGEGTEQSMQAAQIFNNGAAMQLRSMLDEGERGGSVRDVHEPARPTSDLFLPPDAAKRSVLHHISPSKSVPGEDSARKPIGSYRAKKRTGKNRPIADIKQLA